MNLDYEMRRQSGRTTRMLQQAIAWARDEQSSLIFASDSNHMGSLGKYLETLIPKDDQKKLRGLITVCRFGDATQGNVTRHLGVYRNYDYRNNSWVRVDPATSPEDRAHVLIDHHALERHLVNVISYLRTARRAADPVLWMIDTARMMSVVGRRAYIVSDDEESRMIMGNALKGYNVSVEDGTMLGGLDLLNQRLIGAHPAAILLIEPKMLERYFAGALTEMNRWNAQ